jgi:hypothetical protein
LNLRTSPSSYWKTMKKNLLSNWSKKVDVSHVSWTISLIWNREGLGLLRLPSFLSRMVLRNHSPFSNPLSYLLDAYHLAARLEW